MYRHTLWLLYRFCSGSFTHLFGVCGTRWRRHSVALLTVHFYLFSLVLLKNLMHKLWSGALQAMCHRKCYVQVDRGFVNGCDTWTTQSERCLYKPVVLVFLPIRKKSWCIQRCLIIFMKCCFYVTSVLWQMTFSHCCGWIVNK